MDRSGIALAAALATGPGTALGTARRIALGVAAAGGLGGCASGGDTDFVPPTSSIGPATTVAPSTSGASGTGDETTAPPDPSSTTGEPPNDDTTGAPVQPPPWLVSIDDQGTEGRLMRIDLGVVSSEQVCALPAGRNYNSATFTRNGELLAYSAVLDAIQRIDPCSCTAADVMPGLGNMRIAGGENETLYGLVAATGETYALAPALMTSMLLSNSGQVFGSGAIAWSDNLGALYLLNADTDQLYHFDPAGPTTSLIGSLAADVGGVGLTYHHGDDTLYACTATGQLLTVDTASGSTADAGNVGFAGCDNLAAPWAPVACI